MSYFGDTFSATGTLKSLCAYSILEIPLLSLMQPVITNWMDFPLSITSFSFHRIPTYWYLMRRKSWESNNK